MSEPIELYRFWEKLDELSLSELRAHREACKAEVDTLQARLWELGEELRYVNDEIRERLESTRIPIE